MQLRYIDEQVQAREARSILGMDFGSAVVYAPKDGSKQEYEHIPESRYNHVVKAYSSGASASYDPNDDGQTCLLDILDTAGQEEYSAMRDQYVRCGDCFLLVYAINSRQSFDEVQAMHQWINRMRDQDMPMVVVGNKCDLDSAREVSTSEGAAYATSIGAPFFEASAKLNLNVTEAMHELIRHTPRLHGKEYKVIIQGAGGVGKSSICNQYVCGHFVEDYDPTIEDSYRKQVVIPGLPKPKSKKKDEKKGGASSGGHGKRRSFLGSLFHRSKGATPTEGAVATPTATPTPKPEEEKTVKVKRSNSNALVLQLGSLAKEPSLTTGDPCYCQQCSAAVSHLSQLTSQGDTTVWTCEFCGYENVGIELSPDATPSDSTADYLLEPAPKEEEEEGEDEAGPDNEKETKKGASKEARSQRSNLVIFAVDISGSMSTTVEVPALQAEWSSVTGRGGGGGGPRFISRLEAIKEAVCRHVDHMSVTEPRNKVALVVFDNKVQYYGDGGSGKSQLDSGSLDDYNILMKQGQVFGSDLSLREIQDSLEDIKARVKSLSTGGTTALGPALALCVGMTSNFPSGEIVLCTDGVSNVGVGNLESGRNDSAFYTTMGEHAQVSHTTISVLGIEGATCAMEALSACAAVTHGTVNILHPLEMVRQIRLIAQNPTIATDVEVTYIMHPAIGVEKKSESKCVTMVKEQLGNATRESDVSITFTVDGSHLKNLRALPFQVQIRYCRKDGSKWLRVISQSRQVTREREEMEKASNVAIVGLAAVQRSAQLAQAGKIQESREVLHAVEQVIHRGAKSDQQQEEHAIFREAADRLDRALMDQTSRKGSGLSDGTAKALHSNRNAHMAQFLSGAAKRELVEQRRAGEAVQQQYYSYKFK